MCDRKVRMLKLNQVFIFILAWELSLPWKYDVKLEEVALSR